MKLPAVSCYYVDVGKIATQVSNATIDICRTLQQSGNDLFIAWLSNGGKTIVLKGKSQRETPIDHSLVDRFATLNWN